MCSFPPIPAPDLVGSLVLSRASGTKLTFAFTFNVLRSLSEALGVPLNLPLFHRVDCFYVVEIRVSKTQETRQFTIYTRTYIVNTFLALEC